MPNKLLIISISLICFATTCSSAIAKELDFSLREASILYQSGRNEEAIQKAQLVSKHFPKNLEALLILGRAEFELENYAKARNWLRKAYSINPKHPLIKRYLGLIREIENRYGPIPGDFQPPAQKDKLETARDFKKGWFGPNFTVTSAPLTPEPKVILKNAPASTTNVISPTALPTPHPPVNLVLLTDSVEKMAKEAFDKKLYIKSYLFYSQLNRQNPGNRKFLLGKSKAAFHMKRFREVIKALGPLLTTNPASFTDEQRKQAKELVQKSRTKVYR